MSDSEFTQDDATNERRAKSPERRALDLMGIYTKHLEEGWDYRLCEAIAEEIRDAEKRGRIAGLAQAKALAESTEPYQAIRDHVAELRERLAVAVEALKEADRLYADDKQRSEIIQKALAKLEGKP